MLGNPELVKIVVHPLGGQYTLQSLLKAGFTMKEMNPVTGQQNVWEITLTRGYPDQNYARALNTEIMKLKPEGWEEVYIVGRELVPVALFDKLSSFARANESDMHEGVKGK